MPTPYNYRRDDFDFDFDYCEECGACVMEGVVHVDGAPFCKEHAPLVMDTEDFELIYDKAGVDRPG
jgi:hypothetical protein